MRTNIKLLFTSIFLAGSLFVWAQQKTITGQVTDSDGFPVADAYVYVEGSENGVYTDANGNYTLSVNEGDQVAIEYIGYETKTVSVGNELQYNVAINRGGAITLSSTVATALGIEREKKSLGFATQEVGGETLSDVPTTNFVDALSGEVAGLDIKSSGTMGGSSNIIVRGFSSLTGNNQALIVVDGTPIINPTDNDSGQNTGRGGVDYGNAASDINPQDIESVNVLKGGAATSLYGSRAQNGAIIITTKKGNKDKGIGVTFSSSYTAGVADKETLPVYQNKYGAGYTNAWYNSDDGYFILEDFTGNGTLDEVVPFGDDASFGAAFDPNREVVQWFNIYPQLESTYGQTSPWVAGANTPNDFLKTSHTFENSLSIGKSSDEHSIRLGYTNRYQTGILPNSEIERNTLTFSGSQDVTERLTANLSLTYTNNEATGRYGTGYSTGNPFQAFRQWWQTNVDIKQQEEAYNLTGQNITWNTNSSSNLEPLYSDNPYWNRYHNYTTDSKDRIFGNVGLNFEVTEWFSVLGRVTADTYSEVREGRIDVGAADVSEYSIENRNLSEYNYDIIGSFNHEFSEAISLDGNIGWNLRVQSTEIDYARTNGGLEVPGLFSLDNTRNPLTQEELFQYLGKKKVDGIYARASLGFYDKYFLEGSARRDRSSTLPIDNNDYFYYSGSLSYVFSEDLNLDFLTFGKLRANFARVGNDTEPYQLLNTYSAGAPFGGQSTFFNPLTFKNANLKPEFSDEYEVGLEANFLRGRFSLDVSYYNRLTTDLITPTTVTTTSGARSTVLNGGDIRNKGFEVFATVMPVKSEDFQWEMKFNFADNTNEVEDLAAGIEFLELASVQGGISIGAYKGSPYGVILGSDYIYHDGQRVILPNGNYAVTDEGNNIIGDMNPDWTGGFKNTFRYKGFSASFLIDVQKGGDIFSLDTWYGYGTGLYDWTAGNNDLGNPIRDLVVDGGGVLLEGVQGDITNNGDGTYTVTNATQNDVRTEAYTYNTSPYGWANAPNAMHVYDASFVKLREASISYRLPEDLIRQTKLKGVTLSLIGRNLWIIHKNVPYADPEAGLSAGNIQGYHSGAYPSVREIGASLKVEL